MTRSSNGSGSGRRAVRIDLPHIHAVKKRLADGRVQTYYYHRLTRKRIHGQPGTPEFLESYRQAASDDGPPRDTLAGIIHDFVRSPEFSRLAPRTRNDYHQHMADLEGAFGDAPLQALEDRRFRALALKERDRIAQASAKRADYWWAVLRRVLSWAVDRGLLQSNVCRGGGKLYTPDRRDRIWSPEQIAALMEVASAEMRLAVLLALYTAQRQGDILALRWSAWDGRRIELTQQKTGQHVIIPAVAPLRTALEAAPRRAITIITNPSGRPWPVNSFRSAFAKTRQRASITGLTFHDLRGTCLTWLAQAGCTQAEIAAISGHKTTSHSAMDGYVSRTAELAEAAISKLQSWLERPRQRFTIRT